MHFVGLLFAIGAALGFATLDMLRKRLSTRVALVPLLLWLTLGVIPLFSAWAQFSGEGLPPTAYWPSAVGSICLNVFANLLFLTAVRDGEFSRTIPLLSLTPVVAALVAVPLLGEIPRPVQAAGILMVVLGAMLLQRVPDTKTGLRTWPPSAWMMIAVAVAWAAATPLDKLAIRHGGVATHALILHLGITLALGVWLIARRELGSALRAVAASPGLILVAVLVSAIALGSQMLALETLDAALLETMKRGLGGAAALCFGALFFGEKVTVPKLLAIAIMSVGVALLF